MFGPLRGSPAARLIVARAAASKLLPCKKHMELPYPSPQVSYVNCMATIALIQMMDPDHDHPIRESCKSVGATVKYSPPVPRDVYRDRNLQKASN